MENPKGIKAVIFDLDGVIVSTDEYHYQAWKKVADENSIHFDRMINERLRGISRMESLEIVLEKSKRTYSNEEKIQMAQDKNTYYRKLLENLSPEDILPGVLKLIETLKALGVKIAIGSSSKNAVVILERIKLNTTFDAVADGNAIKHSKPDPEVFLLAAKLLGVRPVECVVIEDADAGINAAVKGGMKAVGVGSASDCSATDYGIKDLSVIDIDKLLFVK